MTLVNLPEIAYGVADTRHWCAYCFGVLNSEDEQVERREFVHCIQCQSRYHTNCWHQSERCVKCGAHDTMTFIELLCLSSVINTQPVQAARVKPSTVFYYFAGSAYEVPPFILEKIVPEYEYWYPRIQATLRLWHTKAKESIQNGLIQASQQLLAQERASQIGQFVQSHLDVLTRILVYICYVIAFLLVRMLLRLIF